MFSGDVSDVRSRVNGSANHSCPSEFCGKKAGRESLIFNNDFATFVLLPNQNVELSFLIFKCTIVKVVYEKKNH